MTNNFDHIIFNNNGIPDYTRICKVFPYIIAMLLYVIPYVTHAQIDPGLLLGLNTATTTEMNAINGSITGSMIYNTTDKKVYYYNGTNWVTPSNDNWLLDGNTAVSEHHF